MKVKIKVLIPLLIFSLLTSSLLFYFYLKTMEGGEVSPINLVELCSDNESCYVDYFTKMSSKGKTERALKMLESISLSHGAIINCHAVAHSIGEKAYESNGDKALSILDRGCSGGYLHGVADRASRDLDGNGYIKFYTKYCLAEENFTYAVSCVHGIGHALYKNKFSVSESNKICNKIAENIDKVILREGESLNVLLMSFSGNCVDGFIMEEYFRNKNVLTDSEVDACHGFTGNNLNFCTFEFFRSRNNFSVTDAHIQEFAGHCLTYSNPDVRGLCAYYVGENIEDLVDKKDSAKMINTFKEICNGEINFAKGCILGFSTKSVSFNLNLDITQSCSAFEEFVREYCLEAFKGAN